MSKSQYAFGLLNDRLFVRDNSHVQALFVLLMTMDFLRLNVGSGSHINSLGLDVLIYTLGFIRSSLCALPAGCFWPKVQGDGLSSCSALPRGCSKWFSLVGPGVFIYKNATMVLTTSSCEVKRVKTVPCWDPGLGRRKHCADEGYQLLFLSVITVPLLLGAPLQAWAPRLAWTVLFNPHSHPTWWQYFYVVFCRWGGLRNLLWVIQPVSGEPGIKVTLWSQRRDFKHRLVQVEPWAISGAREGDPLSFQTLLWTRATECSRKEQGNTHVYYRLTLFITPQCF